MRARHDGAQPISFLGEQLIKLKKADSSNVKAFGYDDKTKTLVVAFNGGKTYKYNNVSKQRYEAFSKSDSLGAYVNNKLSSYKAKQI